MNAASHRIIVYTVRAIIEGQRLCRTRHTLKQITSNTNRSHTVVITVNILEAPRKRGIETSVIKMLNMDVSLQCIFLWNESHPFCINDKCI